MTTPPSALFVRSRSESPGRGVLHCLDVTSKPASWPNLKQSVMDALELPIPIRLEFERGPFNIGELHDFSMDWL